MIFNCSLGQFWSTIHLQSFSVILDVPLSWWALSSHDIRIISILFPIYPFKCQEEGIFSKYIYALSLKPIHTLPTKTCKRKTGHKFITSPSSRNFNIRQQIYELMRNQSILLELSFCVIKKKWFIWFFHEYLFALNYNSVSQVGLPREQTLRKRFIRECFGESPSVERMGGNQNWAQEELGWDIVSPKFSAYPLRNSEAEWPFKIAPNWSKRVRSLLTSHWMWPAQKRGCHLGWSDSFELR